MKNTIAILILIGILSGCTTKDKYDISQYYDLKEQDSVLTSIIAYIYSAPLYTKMEDRFQPQHRAYYSSLTSKFEIVDYFIAPDSTHFFYLIRPSSIASERRAVGGHFKMNKNYQLTEFREEFVTVVMKEQELKTKANFLFDEMVKGDINKYVGMKDYVQWPGGVYLYDTAIYEWKLKPEVVN